MTEPVRWGILSTAQIGLNRGIPAMQSMPMCSIDAIASRSEATARAAADKVGIKRAHGSYEALLADPDIEAVYIPLPNHMHVEWCKKALEAGKHVLCEKPLSMTADEAKPLLALRDKTGLHIEEGFAIRNHPQWAAIRRTINNGEIGDLRYVQTTLAFNNVNPNDIRNKPDVGGGGLYDLGCYAIVGCRYIFNDEPVRVVSAMEYDPTFKVDRLTSVLMQFPTGHATLTVCTQAGPAHGGTLQHLQAVGTKGWTRSDFPYAHRVPEACRVMIGDDASIGTQHAREISFPAVNQYALQGERFSRLVRGEAVERFPLEDGIANMKVLDAVFRSAKSGAWETV